MWSWLYGSFSNQGSRDPTWTSSEPILVSLCPIISRSSSISNMSF
ncbi:hypothetical protein HanPSC8_Chr09g0368841 [Helianthus annuus]|nr:hypothetical protein HanPSC8_Chr09g0368841 [Helianthus annuus]